VSLIYLDRRRITSVAGGTGEIFFVVGAIAELHFDFAVTDLAVIPRDGFEGQRQEEQRTADP